MSLARQHTQYAIDSYGSKPSEAARHTHLALAYNAVLTPRQTNNLGYILLRSGESVPAENLFREAYDATDSARLRALVTYNLATLNCRKGDLTAALNYVNECMSLVPQLSEEDKKLGWLEEATFSKGRVSIAEVRNPHLDTMAARLHDSLKQAVPKAAASNP